MTMVGIMGIPYGNIRGVSLTSEISDIKIRRFVVLKNVYHGI